MGILLSADPFKSGMGITTDIALLGYAKAHGMSFATAFEVVTKASVNVNAHLNGSIEQTSAKYAEIEETHSLPSWILGAWKKLEGLGNPDIPACASQLNEDGSILCLIHDLPENDPVEWEDAPVVDESDGPPSINDTFNKKNFTSWAYAHNLPLSTAYEFIYGVTLSSKDYEAFLLIPFKEPKILHTEQTWAEYKKFECSPQPHTAFGTVCGLHFNNAPKELLETLSPEKLVMYVKELTHRVSIHKVEMVKVGHLMDGYKQAAKKTTAETLKKTKTFIIPEKPVPAPMEESDGFETITLRPNQTLVVHPEATTKIKLPGHVKRVFLG